jgi:hypothetical protein
MAHTATAFAHIPQSLQVWLRFAQSAPSPAPAGAKLGSFCTSCLRRPPQAGVFQSTIRNRQSAILGPPGPKLGSFCTFHSPAEPRPTRQPPLPIYPSPPKFGFVLHSLLRHPPPAGEIGFVWRILLSACRRRQGPSRASGPNHQPQITNHKSQASGIVTNGTTRTAVNGAERLFRRRFACVVLTLPAGRNASCGLAVPSARRRFYI